jgi:predicted transposase YdaD
MPDTFVDEDLSLTAADLIWKLKFKNSEYFLIFLLEHKSFIDQLTIRQILKYKLRIWDKLDEVALEKKEPRRKLPIIIPIVLYHGRADWQFKPFREYFEEAPEVFYEFIPEFRIIFVNLTGKSDEEILSIRASFLVTTLLLFRHYHDESYLIENTELILSSMEKINSNTPKWSLVQALLTYFLANVEQTEEKTQIIYEKIENIMKQKRTLYDAMILEPIAAARTQARQEALAEGEARGEARGEANTKRLMVEGLWEDGFPMERICKLTRLTQEQVQAIMRELVGLEIFEKVKLLYLDKQSNEVIAQQIKKEKIYVERIINYLLKPKRKPNPTKKNS